MFISFKDILATLLIIKVYGNNLIADWSRIQLSLKLYFYTMEYKAAVIGISQLYILTWKDFRDLITELQTYIFSIIAPMFNTQTQRLCTSISTYLLYGHAEKGLEEHH